jgi:hypothetical protein
MKTNYLFTLVTLLAVTLCLNAQEETEMKYIFSGDKKIKVSGFIGPIMEFSAINNDFAFFMGGGGGLLFNQRFYFAGYGEGLTTVHESKYWEKEKYGDDKGYNDEKDEDRYEGKISFGHGGFWLGYILHPQKPIHFGISSKIGWGSINTVSEYDFDEYYFGKDDYYLDHVFVAIPQLEVEFSFTKWFKANVGVGYRIVSGIDKKINEELVYDKKDFNKPQGTITLCFGFFK